MLVAGVRVDTVEECGVKQSRITVTYRFSQPDQPMPLVLTQSCRNGCGVRIPSEPCSVGDHIWLRRLGLKMLQRESAELPGVVEASIWNWEANVSRPDYNHMPAIIAFLGYNPLPEVTKIAEQLVRLRTTLGLSQKETARQAGVDPTTLARWERGERVPSGAALGRVEGFLNGDDCQDAASRPVGSCRAEVRALADPALPSDANFTTIATPW